MEPLANHLCDERTCLAGTPQATLAKLRGAEVLRKRTVEGPPEGVSCQSLWCVSKDVKVSPQIVA